MLSTGYGELGDEFNIVYFMYYTYRIGQEVLELLIVEDL